jgi:quercetin dioxygenase-like cupin family protein
MQRKVTMKIIHYADAEAKVFTGDQVKGAAGRVVVGLADGATNFCMRVFELSVGGYTTRHTHEWEHEVFIHRGEGVVFNGGQWIPVASGTAVFIPPHEEHQIRNSGDEPFVFVCVIPSGYPEI